MYAISSLFSNTNIKNKYDDNKHLKREEEKLLKELKNKDRLIYRASIFTT